MMMQFSERGASSGWEPVALPDAPGRFVWAWFRPPAAPDGAFVQIPDETYQALAAGGPPLTLRSLAWSLGLDPAMVAYGTVHGVSFDSASGTNPYWDHTLSDPGPVPDRTLGFFLNPQFVSASGATPVTVPVGAMAAPQSVLDCFTSIDADWNASIQLEIQLASAGLQLKGTLGRVTSLNRDLMSEEARYADQRDKAEWQDARRWLRDVGDRVSRFLKDYQTGVTSIAGKRNHYEYLYETYITRRIPFQGIEQTAREFESHRKNLQTLLSNMSMAQNSASQDGERRAQQILTRIAAKVRSARTKRA